MSVFGDFRYASRSLLRGPLFTTAALLTLALGIGINCAIFSIVNAVLLRPLPFRDPEGLTKVWARFSLKDPDGKAGFSLIEFVDLRKQNKVFEDVAAYNMGSINLTGGEEPEEVPYARVSPGLFKMLGVSALQGRALTAEDEEPDTQVVLVSHSSWQTRFGSAPDLVGKTLTLDGKSYTVVGIMPPEFRFPGKVQPWGYVEFWVPRTINPATLPTEHSGSQYRYLDLIARLKPGVSPEQAQAGLDSVAQQFRDQFPDAYRPDAGWIVESAPLLEAEVGPMRRALNVLSWAGALVLLITCANVANLLLTRNLRRKRDLSIRMAIGASRRQVLQQLLSESLVLAMAGGVLGLLVGYWGVQALVRLIPPDIPRIDEVGLDPRVFVFTLVISLVAGLLAGIAPVLFISRSTPVDEIKEGGTRTTLGLGGHRLRSSMIVAEVALALVMLIGAGLLIKNFFRLLRSDLGFNPENVLTLKISLPSSKYGEDPQMVDFFQRLLQQVKGLPGVRSAAAVSHLPLGGTNFSHGISIEGIPVDPSESTHEVDYFSVSPDYFQSMGIALMKGRAFTDLDHASSPPVIVIDDRLAQRFWPDVDPIGKHLKRGRPDSERPWLTVVGVVRHVHHYGVGAEAEAEEKDQIYYPYTQNPVDAMSLVLRTDPSSPSGLIDAVRREVLAIDKDQPIATVRTMKDWFAESLSRPRFSTLLLSIFAAAALFLVIVGMYAAVAASTAERTHEIGVRMALGAKRADVLKLVISQGLVLGLLGIALGVVASLLATRLLSSQLYGVSATDTVTFIGVSTLLILVMLLATYVPAWRAARVDPLLALRDS